jgi:hypothetical protein
MLHHKSMELKRSKVGNYIFCIVKAIHYVVLFSQSYLWIYILFVTCGPNLNNYNLANQYAIA